MSETTIPTSTVRARALPATVGNQTHALEDLRRRVVGRLHTPIDGTWDAVRSPWSSTRTPAAWWTPATRERLAAVKQVSDPPQSIRSNRSVRV